MPKQKSTKPKFAYKDYDPVATYSKKEVFVKELVVWKLEILFKAAQRKMQGRAKFVGRRESTSTTDIHWKMLWSINHGVLVGKGLIHYCSSFDSRALAGPNRILVFDADDALDHLASSDTWFIDGNFKVSPTIFIQVYVICAKLDQGAVLC